MLQTRLGAKPSNDCITYGVETVSTHSMPDGTERPIAFASRILTNSEQEYAQLERDALKTIFCINKFHEFLFGQQFTLITYHKPLMSLFGAK